MPIAAIIMEWIFNLVDINDGRCPTEMVQELTELFLDNDYHPYLYEERTSTLKKLAVHPERPGTDWEYDAVIWLHHPSIPTLPSVLFS